MDRIIKDLIRDEGLKLEAYKDSLGYWTIGIGHYLGTEKRMSKITKAEAMALVEMDIREAERLLVSLDLPLAIGVDRWAALTNMAFNLGNRLKQFKRFIAAVKVLDWATAGKEMADSTWAKQVGQRAVRLRKVIETGSA